METETIIDISHQIEPSRNFIFSYRANHGLMIYYHGVHRTLTKNVTQISKLKSSYR
jgi:hypothetical protein